MRISPGADCYICISLSSQGETSHSEGLSGLPWQFTLTTTQKSPQSPRRPRQIDNSTLRKITLCNISQCCECKSSATTTTTTPASQKASFLINTPFIWCDKWEMNYIKMICELFRFASGALWYTCQFIWSMFAIIAFVNSCHYFLLDMML